MSNGPSPLACPERPPFRGGPPVRTTFDGFSSGDSEPDFEIYLESAEKLLKVLEVTKEPDRLPMMLRLLEQRRSWLQEQLWALRSMEQDSLPPLRGLEMADLFEPKSSLEARLVAMLSRLSEAILRVNLCLDMQESPFPLSEF